MRELKKWFPGCKHIQSIMNNDQHFIDIAKNVRRDILSMSYRAKSAHSGGAYSCVEILVSLYFNVMKVFPKDAENPNRDRLIFSKAHDAKALYAVLAQRGFFPKKILEKYEVDDGVLPGHSTRHCVPGVEISAGSLGHGLSMAAGVAYALKIKSIASDNKFFLDPLRASQLHTSAHSRIGDLLSTSVSEREKRSSKKLSSLASSSASPRVFAILSDGECDEGSTWEAAMFAGHHHLDNLTVIVDYNKLQGYGFTKDILDLEPFAEKWRAFGFAAKEVNGHLFKELIFTLSSLPFIKGKPSVVIAHTIKGLGGPKKHVGQISSQYKPPTEEEYKQVLKELS